MCHKNQGMSSLISLKSLKRNGKTTSIVTESEYSRNGNGFIRMLSESAGIRKLNVFIMSVASNRPFRKVCIFLDRDLNAKSAGCRETADKAAINR